MLSWRNGNFRLVRSAAWFRMGVVGKVARPNMYLASIYVSHVCYNGEKVGKQEARNT